MVKPGNPCTGSLFFLLIAALLVSGCGSGANSRATQALGGVKATPAASGSGEPLTFGIIYPMVNPTYETITENAETAASMRNVRLLVQAPDEANLEQQIRIMEMMIKQGVDGIAIDPVDSDAIIPVINKARDRGIPVVCFESDSPDSRRIAFIGADNYKTGEVIGSTVDRLLQGRGMILVENGMPHMLGLGERQKGLLDYLLHHTKIDVLETQNNDGSEAGATEQLEAMIERHPHFSALISLDFVSSASSILIWKAKGLKRINVALGLTPDVKQSLNNGQISGIISQNEQHWGESIIVTLLKAASGFTVPEFVDTGITEIYP